MENSRAITSICFEVQCKLVSTNEIIWMRFVCGWRRELNFDLKTFFLFASRKLHEVDQSRLKCFACRISDIFSFYLWFHYSLLIQSSFSYNSFFFSLICICSVEGEQKSLKHGMSKNKRLFNITLDAEHFKMCAPFNRDLEQDHELSALRFFVIFFFGFFLLHIRLISQSR